MTGIGGFAEYNVAPAEDSMKAAKKRAPTTAKAKSKTKASGYKRQMNKELMPIYEALVAILKPYEKKLKKRMYAENFYYLETHEPVYRGKPMCYGGVRLGKQYVSYYLMCVYAAPELSRNMSPELKKRMQGKSCFNFTKVDEALFAELKALTRIGAAKFDAMDWKKLEETTSKWTELRGKG
jgi:hypothetical protein